LAAQPERYAPWFRIAYAEVKALTDGDGHAGLPQ
jgi:hypothetical protein